MSGIVTCPLDVIKTKLQAQGGFRLATAESPQHLKLAYKGMMGTGKIILKEEGLRGLYRGLGPIILGYLPTWAVWFTVYGKTKEAALGSGYSQFSANFMSSLVAGSTSTVVTNPIWVVKTRMMSQVSSASSSVSRPPWHYTSTLDAFRKMYRTEGILSFYSGLTPALLGLSHVAVQFPLYEYLKTQFTGHGMGSSGGPDAKSQWVGVFFATVFSKIIASSATYPHEVLRTRLQTQQRQLSASPSISYTQYSDSTQANPEHRPPMNGSNGNGNGNGNGPRYKGVLGAARTILKEEGWRAFYAGMGTNMMRAVPAACTTMLTFEYVVAYLGKTKKRAVAHEQQGFGHDF